MDIKTAKQIIGRYGRNSKMSILYNESPLKVINGKLVVNYLQSHIEDGSWSSELEEYSKTHKADVIQYFQARGIVFEHSLAEYDRKHRAVLRPTSKKNKLGK